MGELLLGSKGQCGLQKGWAVCLEWPPSLNFLPSLPLARGVRKEPYSEPFPPSPPQVAVQVPKPAFFRHLLSAEHTREEARASEPLPYEKYNKENWNAAAGEPCRGSREGLQWAWRPVSPKTQMTCHRQGQGCKAFREPRSKLRQWRR